jgi:hypothetical protein
MAGFSSVALNGDRVGEERLVYLMRIGQKLHLRDYFDNPLFQDKIPDMGKAGPIAKAGDNIYRPLVPGACEYSHFEQLLNPNHWAPSGPCDFHRERDLSGQYALIADEFYYFGALAQNIPDEFRPWLPKGQSAYGRLTPQEQANGFIRFIREHYKPGRHGNPMQWPENEGQSIPSCGGR